METVRVLYSRSRVGVKGALIRVTPERKRELIELGLVESVNKPVETEKKTKKSQKGD